MVTRLHFRKINRVTYILLVILYDETAIQTYVQLVTCFLLVVRHNVMVGMGRTAIQKNV